MSEIAKPILMTTTSNHHLICFSHLRWDFVLRRPQHLMTRFARHFPVVYIEEAVYGEGDNRLEVSSPAENIRVIVPHIQAGLHDFDTAAVQKELLAGFLVENDITQYFLWYYTPSAIAISDHLNPVMTIYDCLDEFASARFAPSSAPDREKELLRRADLVFTAGYSLFEAKKHRHADVHIFPNGIDGEHFRKARMYTADPNDQSTIPHPRIGYFGVIDERMDFTLIANIARRKPEWHFVLVGPVTRGIADGVPKLANIHHLGTKPYEQLPDYISHWDIAILPFAHNEATRYISPAKTPEYLAAGKPVISTPITDVLRQYGRNGLVSIAGTPEEFVRVASLHLETSDREEWLEQVDDYLSHNSWEKTWQSMMYLVNRKLTEKERNMKSAGDHVYV